MIDSSQETWVQRWLILPKLIYFWLGMAIYTVGGSFNVLLHDEWAFSTSTIGFLNAFQGINFVGAIFWTSLADRTGKQKWLLAGATLMNSLCLLVFSLPKLIKYTFLDKRVEIAFSMGIMTLAWFFQSAMFPLLDSAMLGILTKNPRFTKDQFGYQRLWLSPAHVIGTFLGGFAQGFKENKTLYYQCNTSVSAAIFILLVLIAIPNIHDPVPKSFTHHGHHEKGKPNHISQATALPLAPSPIVPAAPEIDLTAKKKERSPAMRLLADPSFLFFLLFVISAGLLANVFTIFQQLGAKKNLDDQKNLNNGLFGPAAIAATTRIPAAFSEIVVYLVSKPLTQAIGVYWLLLFSQFAGIIRAYCYAIKTPFWLKYPIEVLKGLNSGFIVSAGVRIASDIAPPGCSTSAQGLFSGTYKGIAISLTGIFGGAVLIAFQENLQRLFLVTGIVSTITTALFFCKFLFVDRVIGIPGFPLKEKVPVVVHNTPSTSSFGSAVSSEADQADTKMAPKV